MVYLVLLLFYRHYRNRLLAKKAPWMRISDHDHLTPTGVDVHTPTLTPVFDPVLSMTRIVSPVKHFSPALQYVSSVNSCGICIHTDAGFEGVHLKYDCHKQHLVIGKV
jgi:hypothetical protein